MKISTRGRYGLKAMIDIASNNEENKCITVRSISKRQGISEAYLEQLISSLRKSELLKSVRGSSGGYILNRPAEEINVGDILRATEGEFKIVACLTEDSNLDCGQGSCKTCATKIVWEKLQLSIDDVVDNISLKELVNNYNELIENI